MFFYVYFIGKMVYKFVYILIYYFNELKSSELYKFKFFKYCYINI